jgi:O-antigen/teichoic acid export membrane protein
MQRSAFIRHVTTLWSGKLASQLLSLALVPIVARLFEPADFGAMAIFLTVTNILAVAAALGYFRASLLTSDDARARILLAMSLKSLAAGCALVACLILVSDLTGVVPALVRPLGVWIWLLPVGMLVQGMCRVLATVHTRQQTFGSVAKGDFTEVLLMGSSRIIFGLGGSSIWGLVVAYLIGGAGRMYLLARNTLNPFKLMVMRTPWPEVKALASEYRDFPLLNMPAGLVNFVSGKVPILVMGVMFSPAAVGLYAMGESLIRKPVVLAGNSVREVFIRKLTGNTHQGLGLLRPTTMLTLAMLLLGIVPFGILSFFGTEILTLILGDRWTEAGVYVQILAPWYYAVWVTTGVQPTLIALRRQGLWLKAQIGMLLIRIGVFVAGDLAAVDILTTLRWFSGANVLISLSLLALMFYLVSTHRGSTPGKNATI